MRRTSRPGIHPPDQARPGLPADLHVTHPQQTCNASGCPTLIPTGAGGLCDQHRRPHQHQQEQRRGTRQQRGYDAVWLRLRTLILQRDPMCRIRIACADRSITQQTSTQVDHIVPLRVAPHLRLVPSNLQGCCGPCNTAKRDVDAATWPVS